MWYTKGTWSAKYLNYYSNNRTSHIKTVIIGIIDRAIKLSDPEYREKAIEKAKKCIEN